MDIFVRYFTEIQKNLETLLEDDRWKKTDGDFQIETNLQVLDRLSIGLPEKPEERAVIVFSRLLPFFNAGLLFYRKSLTRQSECWVPGAAFQNGRYSHLPEKVERQQLHLPKIALGEIKKTSPYLILAPIQMDHLSDTADSAAFVFKVHDQFLYTVYSELPEPWLRRQIETVFSKVQVALIDGIK
jgi:hypothetical protein